MTSIVFTIFLIFFFERMETAVGTDTFCMDINPEKCISAMESATHISCSVENDSREIVVLEMSRNDGKPFVYLRHCSDIVFPNKLTTQIQAEGYIDKEGNQTYLNVTLLHPKSDDTGIYTCTMHYLDKEGVLKEEKTSKNLQVEKLDVKSLETVLTNMKKEIAVLKTDNKRQIDELKEQVTYMVAFSATTKNTMAVSNGQVIVLPHLLLSVGGGYNTSTGIFTAPRAGFYEFHLTAEMKCGSCYVVLELKVNDKTVISLLAGDKTYEEQSSLSTLVILSQGDKVVVSVSAIVGGPINKDPFTRFTGYLVKPL